MVCIEALLCIKRWGIVTFKRFPMAFRPAIIALENKSFEMPIVELFTTMTSLAYLDSSSADNCRFCFQSGNAWSVIAAV